MLHILLYFTEQDVYVPSMLFRESIASPCCSALYGHVQDVWGGSAFLVCLGPRGFLGHRPEGIKWGKPWFNWDELVIRHIFTYLFLQRGNSSVPLTTPNHQKSTEYSYACLLWTSVNISLEYTPGPKITGSQGMHKLKLTQHCHGLHFYQQCTRILDSQSLSTLTGIQLSEV